MVLEKVAMAIILNVGLWLSTTPLGKKNKYLTLGIMLPTILLAPFVMPKKIFLIGSVAVTCVVALSIYRLFKKEV